MADNDKMIEARLLQAPKLATSSKALSRLLKNLIGKEEEVKEETTPDEWDNKSTKENQPKLVDKKIEQKQVDASTSEQQKQAPPVLEPVPVAPPKNNAQPKKKQTKSKPKQNNGQKKSKVPAAGFVIEEEAAAPVQGGKQKKSPPSYVDQLIKETIEKEKEKQAKAQQKKAKKAQKKQAAAKTEQVSDDTPIVAAVATNASASKVTPVKSVISDTPVPRVQEPEPVDEDKFDDSLSLSEMSYDVLLNLIKYINWTDLMSLACVNYKLSTVTHESHVWKTLCMKYLPSAPLIVKNFMKGDKSRAGPVETTWRSMFLRGREFVKNELRCFHTKLSFEDDVLVSRRYNSLFWGPS